MAYSNQFLKITWMFSVKASDEIADTSINYTTAPGWTGAAAALAELDPDDEGATLYGLYHSVLMDPASISWADYSVLTGVKIAAVGTDGHYLADPLIFEAPSPTDGTAVGVIPQSTVVLSLRSGFTLGGGNYGRMYLPHTTLGTEAETPRASAAIAAAKVADAVEFVNSVSDTLNDVLTATVFPAIMSQVGAGSAKGVTELAIGRVTDTQRRRRNRLDEGYATATLA